MSVSADVDYSEDTCEDYSEDPCEDYSEDPYEDYWDYRTLLLSCNSQHQVLVCTCVEVFPPCVLGDEERITISLRCNGSVLWNRHTTFYATDDTPGCLDPHMIFSPQDEFVVTWNTLFMGCGVHVLNAKTGKTCHEFFKLKQGGHIVDCKFVDNESLLCCSKDNFLRLFDIRTGRLLSILDIGEQPFSLGACLYQPLVAIGLGNSKLKFIHVQLPVDSQNKKGSSTKQKRLETTL